MPRCFYIMSVLFLSVACSINTPARHASRLWNGAAAFPFLFEDIAVANDLFPMRCSVKLDTAGRICEFSYSLIKHDSDSIFWEEGFIRFP